MTVVSVVLRDDPLRLGNQFLADESAVHFIMTCMEEVSQSCQVFQ